MAEEQRNVDESTQIIDENQTEDTSGTSETAPENPAPTRTSDEDKPPSAADPAVEPDSTAAAADTGEPTGETARGDDPGATPPSAEIDVETPDPDEPLRELEEAPAEAEPVLTAVDHADELRRKENGGGFTGEIIGRVVTLAELAGAAEEGADDANYAQLRQLIEETLTDVSEHEIVRGRVVSVGEKDVVIDIGFKSDGIVPKNEFERELSPGDEVDVYLERIEDYHGQLVLSKSKADKVRRWQRVEHAYDNEEVLEGTIVRRIKGGMIVELFDELEAFLPGSQIDVRPVRDFDAYLERRMEFKIVKLNPANENIVVSHKALIEKELHAQREKILATMEPGQVLEGTVKNITDFGVFIDLGGVDGLLHITDLSWGRVSHPSELVGLDERLNVVVLDYDKQRQRISLGLKQLQSHPWDDINEKFAEGQVVEGKVVSITDYGAFVELEKGIEGLVHISEMSWTEHVRHPSQMVALGQIVEVKILNIDHEGKKISLGMKQLKPDPWHGIAQRYPAGTVMRGKVRNITNFGVFVEIEPGIDGLVHISDLSWTKKVKHPSEMVRKGQELDVVILNVDENERRISLGHKQVQTNPWAQFQQVYSEGSRTTAVVTRAEDKGIIVELPMGVEGFVPSSELRYGGTRGFQERYADGTELELQVIRFDQGEKEIVLSEIARERAEERERREAEARARRDERDRDRREVRDYGEAASGPTTFAELSGLESLRAQMAASEEAETADTEAAEGAKTRAKTAKKKAAAGAEADAAETSPAEPGGELAPEAAREAADEPAAEAEAEAGIKTEAEAEAVDEAVEEPAVEAEAEAEAEAETEPEAEAAPEPTEENVVVTTAKASGQMEGTPGVTARKGGKRAEESGSTEHPTEPPAKRSRRKEDAGAVPPAEQSKATLKSVGDTEEGAAEAAEEAVEDKTPTRDTGEKPLASLEGQSSPEEIQSFMEASAEEKASRKGKAAKAKDASVDAKTEKKTDKKGGE